MNILIVKFGALGDVIRTSYILPGLYKKYDKPNIVWLTSPTSFDFIQFNPYITEVVTPESGFSSPTSADEIGTFGTGVKLISLTPDYFTYRKDADNSPITSARVFASYEKSSQWCYQ